MKELARRLPSAHTPPEALYNAQLNTGTEKCCVYSMVNSATPQLSRPGFSGLRAEKRADAYDSWASCLAMLSRLWRISFSRVVAAQAASSSSCNNACTGNTVMRVETREQWGGRAHLERLDAREQCLDLQVLVAQRGPQHGVGGARRLRGRGRPPEERLLRRLVVLRLRREQSSSGGENRNARTQHGTGQHGVR